VPELTFHDYDFAVDAAVHDAWLAERVRIPGPAMSAAVVCRASYRLRRRLTHMNDGLMFRVILSMRENNRYG
jgi:hypothetical protein